MSADKIMSEAALIKAALAWDAAYAEYLARGIGQPRLIAAEQALKQAAQLYLDSHR